MVGEGWVEVDDLKAGDHLETDDGKTVVVDDIVVKKKETTVYNFEVAEYHSYFVSNLGIWTHNECGKYRVGEYNKIKGYSGLDAHHVGQKAVMKKQVKNYDPRTGPAINVPKVGHTIRGERGIVSRSTKGIQSPRDLLARDLKELRRVYEDIPNSQLRKLVQLNKEKYPEMRKRRK